MKRLHEQTALKCVLNIILFPRHGTPYYLSQKIMIKNAGIHRQCTSATGWSVPRWCSMQRRTDYLSMEANWCDISKE